MLQMDVSSKIRSIELRSAFFTGSAALHAPKTSLRSISTSPTQSIRISISFNKKFSFLNRKWKNPRTFPRISAVSAETSVVEKSAGVDDLESLFSDTDARQKKSNKPSNSGASGVSSGVRLENISKSFKGVTVLKDVSWEVKKGQKVGLVGVNGAGKTTQMRIIAGEDEPDSGNVIKAKENMKIAFLSQEFEVCPSRTVKEEFVSAFKEEMEIAGRLERVQKALESAVDDLGLMGRLLDELDLLQRKAQAVDLDVVDVKISKMMPELGFGPEDSERLVASYSSGWQMRMSLGKILLQEPDLLLLDEPTNHLDLDTIEWLEGYLKKQDVPMVIISHDRAFLDQLCTKIVETDMGVSRTFEGNYSEYVLAKAAWIESQYAAWEKQQKQIEQTKDIINRLGAGANAGRASSAEKKLEKLQVEDQVEKPFQRKQIKFRFPERGRSGRSVVMIKNLEFGYGDKAPRATARCHGNGNASPEGTGLNLTCPSDVEIGNHQEMISGNVAGEVLNLVESNLPFSEADALDFLSAIDQMKIDTLLPEATMDEGPTPDSPEESPKVVASSEGCSGYAGFLDPDEISIPSLSASLVPAYRGGSKRVLLHKDVLLQLCCMNLRVRFGVSSKFLDHAGRPRLSIVVDAPPSLCRVLDTCDHLAQKLSLDSGCNSEWRPLVTRRNGFNSATIRLNIPTIANGATATYSTEMFQKEPSGSTQRLVFSRIDAAELDSLFVPGTTLDAHFSLDVYDYQQHAGIRLVAKRLIVHYKQE